MRGEARPLGSASWSPGAPGAPGESTRSGERRETLRALGGPRNDDGARAELDTTLADKWIARVNAAPTDADVVSVWEAGIVAIEKAKDQHAYREFKAAVAARRAVLAGGEP